MDDGRGFNPGKAAGATPGQHLGLVSMRERAAFAGGRLDVESAPGRGTTISPANPVGPGIGIERPVPGGDRMSHTVLLADDHTLVRAGLRALLEGLPEVSTSYWNRSTAMPRSPQWPGTSRRRARWTSRCPA